MMLVWMLLVAGMAEARHGQAALLLQARGELVQVREPAARHDDVFDEAWSGRCRGRRRNSFC